MLLSPTDSTSFHQGLLSLLQGKNLADARPVLEPLLAQGIVSLTTPVLSSPHRHPVSFAFAWISDLMSTRSQSSLDREEIATLARWTGNPDWMTMSEGAPAHPESLFDKWMNRHTGRDAIYTTAEPLLASAPIKCMLRWQTPPRFRSDLASHADPGAMFLSQLMESQTQGVDLVPMLADRGFPLNVRNGSGNPVAKEFVTPSQWDAYIQQGHAPDVAVMDRDTQQSQPLWRFLMEHHNGRPLGDHLQQWLNQADPSLSAKAQQAVLELYWRDVDRAYDAEPVIKSRKDWATLRSPSGENALLMQLRKKNWTSFRNLVKIKKALPLLSDRTTAGRTVWHYLLLNGAPSDVRASVLAAGLRNDDRSPSRGALIHAYVDHDSSRYPDVAMGKWAKETRDPSPIMGFLDKANLLDPQWWLAGSPQEQREAVDAMVNRRTLFYSKAATSSGFPDLGRLYSWLAHRWAADGHDVGPAWRGALCLNELATAQPDLEWVADQAALGVELSLTDTRRAELMGRLPPASQAVLRQMEGMALAPQDPPAARRARSRP